MLVEEAAGVIQQCQLDTALRAEVAAVIAQVLVQALEVAPLRAWVLPAAGGALAHALAQLAVPFDESGLQVGQCQVAAAWHCMAGCMPGNCRGAAFPQPLVLQNN